MTNEEVLEQQVEALEKLLKLKQAVIEELESKVNKLEQPNQIPNGINQPYPYIPYQPQPYQPWLPNSCSGGGLHEYPGAWGGTTAPTCTKCGKQLSIFGNITLTGSQGQGATGVAIHDGTSFIDTIKNK